MARDAENKRRINKGLYEANKARNAKRDVRALTPFKVCARCDERRASSEFHIRRGNRDGLASSCKACTAVANRADYAANRTRRREGQRRWRENNAAEYSQGQARYYEANKVRLDAYKREWYRENAESVKARVLRWQQEHPERRLEYQRRRRAATASPLPIPAEHLEGRFKVWGHRCWICGRGDLPLTVDHVKPLARGGAHLPCNLRPACKPCNSAKRDRWPYVPEGVSAGV